MQSSVSDLGVGKRRLPHHSYYGRPATMVSRTSERGMASSCKIQLAFDLKRRKRGLSRNTALLSIP